MDKESVTVQLLSSIPCTMLPEIVLDAVVHLFPHWTWETHQVFIPFH